MTVRLVSAPAAPGQTCREENAASLRSQVVEGRLTSLALPGSPRRVLVYLPPSYERADTARERYPAVYLLHGGFGRAQDWVRLGRVSRILDRLAAEQRIPECIAVMPDAGSPGPARRWRFSNAYDRQLQYEDFVVHDLVKWVDQNFQTFPTPQYRLSAGIAEGAEAAVHMALRHPSVFAGCVGMSGGYGLGSDRELRDLLGDGLGASRRLAGRGALQRCEDLADWLSRLRYVFTCGWLDPSIGHALALHRLLDEFRVAHTFRTYLGSGGWGRWRAGLAGALCELLSTHGTPAERCRHHADQVSDQAGLIAPRSKA